MPDKLIAKFISGKRLTSEEFEQTDEVLNNSENRQELNFYFENSWKKSTPEKVHLKFQQIQSIIDTSKKYNLNRFIIVLSRAAAILFIPLLAAALYFHFGQPQNAEFLTLYTQNGEFTNVMLPDSSKVWLNVDTKLSYSSNFGVKSRDLRLSGEAYFEVKKDKKMPFRVTAGNVTTKALGTHFAISAYPESDVVKSTLLEGSTEVSINLNDYKKILTPGKQLVFNKINTEIKIQEFNEKYELSWKNKELFFQLTPFKEVIATLEKWYDIKIAYNPKDFESETLTVRFEHYETLENVLNVISKTNDFDYSIEDKLINIIKAKHMKQN